MDIFPRNESHALQNVYALHSLKHRPGGGNQIPEMIQVCDYDILIVIGELNTLI